MSLQIDTPVVILYNHKHERICSLNEAHSIREVDKTGQLNELEFILPIYKVNDQGNILYNNNKPIKNEKWKYIQRDVIVEFNNHFYLIINPIDKRDDSGKLISNIQAKDMGIELSDMYVQYLALSPPTHFSVNAKEAIMNVLTAPNSIHEDTAQSASNNTITLNSDASVNNDEYNGRKIVIIDGTGKYEEKRIVDYNGSTKIATVDSDWLNNPDNTSVFRIHNSNWSLGVVDDSLLINNRTFIFEWEKKLKCLFDIQEKYVDSNKKNGYLDFQISWDDENNTWNKKVNLILSNSHNNNEFRNSKNIKSIERFIDSNQPVCTRIIPFGSNNLSINNIVTEQRTDDNITYDSHILGQNHIDNFQFFIKQGYTYQECLDNFIKEYRFSDDIYVDENDLYNDAKEKLEKLSLPKIVYIITIIDRSVLKGKEYEKFKSGDTIKIFEEDLNIDIDATIISTDRNYDNQQLVTIEASNFINNKESVFTKVANISKSYTKEKSQDGINAWSKFSGLGNTLPSGNVEFGFAGSSTKGGNALNVDMVGNKTAIEVQDTVLNFDSRNDRISTIPANPTILSDGSAIDHTVNTDGSINLSFEWLYTGAGDSYNIDGFIVYIYQGDSSSSYTFGSSSSSEQANYVSPDKRAFILQGIPANKYYTFGVQAYRIVDEDISPDGVLKSSIIKSTASGENPYLPSSNVSFDGDVGGTIGGVPYSKFNKSSVTFIVADEDTSNNSDLADYVVPSGSTSAQTVINQAINALPKTTIYSGTIVNCDTTIENPTITLDAGASSVDDYYNDFTIEVAGYKRTISDYDGTTKIAQVSHATGTISNGTALTIYETKGSVELLDGTYIRDGNIIPVSNCTIKGQGNGTIIKTKDGATGNIYGFILDDLIGVTISDLRLDGNKDNSSTSDNMGILFRHSMDNIIDKVTIKNFDNEGINIIRSGGNKITNCNISNCGEEGIQLHMEVSGHIRTDNNTMIGNTCNYNYIGIGDYGDAKDNTINSNICNYNTHGISVGHDWAGYAESFIVSNNTCNYNEREGIEVISHAKNISVRGNTIMKNGWQGIMVDRSDDCLLSNNIIIENEKEGICLSYADNISVLGNICKDNGTSVDNTYSNIEISYNCDNVDVKNNKCRKVNFQPKYGIEISASTAFNTIVTNNDLRNSGQSGNFSDSGTGTVTTAGNQL